jgi:hypothetical protein
MPGACFESRQACMGLRGDRLGPSHALYCIDLTTPSHEYTCKNVNILAQELNAGDGLSFA